MTGPIPILMYHSISTRSSGAFRRWAVPPELFDAHMACVRDEGCVALTISELVAGIREDSLPMRPVAITFDDGFRDFQTEALPILSRYNLSSTLYACTGYIGGTSRWLARQGEGDRPLLSWEGVREVARARVEIGAHTRTHPQLDIVSAAVAREEIIGSRRDLEERLGVPVRSFAYPHGYHSHGIRKLVVDAGFDSACAVKHGLSSRSDDQFALSRIIVDREVDALTLKSWLRGEGLLTRSGKERLQTRGWRAARRAHARVIRTRREV